MGAMELIYTIVGKKTQNQKEREKVDMLREIIMKKAREKAIKMDQYAKYLADDHYVGDITVSKIDGDMVLSTQEKAYPNAVKGSSIYEYIQSEFPEAKMIVVKDDEGYKNIYRHNNKIYNIESDGELSSIEMRRIAQRMDEGLKEYGDER